MSSGPPLLVCPSCALEHPAEKRFCDACGMPLVHAGHESLDASERQQRARKIKPQYTEGELVPVARAGDQPQAEFIANLLLEEGIPCLLRNQIGGYSPMIGPREILVPASGAEAAREVLRARQQPPSSASLLDPED
jgi:Putative prokaryotic signal transducing protein